MLERIYDVLVIEDDPAALEVIVGTLSQFNFRPAVCSDGALAVTKLRSAHYDLVLCDIMLPHLDGLHALEKARESLMGTPVIIVSALSDKDSVLKARELGAAGYVRKPFTVDQLLDRITEALKISGNSLINKRSLPFRIETEKRDSALLMRLYGCPTANPVKELYARASDVIARFPTLKTVQVDVEDSMAYEPRALEFLASLGSMLVKNNGFSRTEILFGGSFFGSPVSQAMIQFKSEWSVRPAGT